MFDEAIAILDAWVDRQEIPKVRFWTMERTGDLLSIRLSLMRGTGSYEFESEVQRCVSVIGATAPGHLACIAQQAVSAIEAVFLADPV